MKYAVFTSELMLDSELNRMQVDVRAWFVVSGNKVVVLFVSHRTDSL